MYKKIIFIIISIIILSFSVTLIFKEKQEFSANENRYLTTEINFTMDKLLDGTFIKNVENYLTDQFPLREKFLSLNTNFKRLLGLKDINNVYISNNEYLIEKYNDPINNDKIIKVINDLTGKLNYVNFNLMLVPTSIEINNELLPKNAITAKQKKNIDYIYKNVNTNTINLYDTLKENNKNYPMFYRLDHHWTSYGAYYSYVEFAKNNDLYYSSLAKYDIKMMSDDFNGTLYSKTNYYNYKPDKIHKFELGAEKLEVDYQTKKTNTLYSEKYLSEKDKYSYFLNNNHPLIVITNKSINDDDEIIILKDSYANCFIPFLTTHYKKIHVIDPRFYKYSISDYVLKNKKIKDGLILYNMQTIDEDTGVLSIK